MPKSTLFNAFKGCLEEIGHGSMQVTSDIYAHVPKRIAARSIEKFDAYMKEIE